MKARARTASRAAHSAAPGRFRGVAPEARLLQRRQMLVDAGIELFGTRGYHATTVRDLCAQARLTERYFYESFVNREALYAAVYETLTQRLREALVAALAPARGDIARMARDGLGALFARLRDDPRLMRILFIDVFTVSEEIDALSRRTTDDFAGLVQELVEALWPQTRARGFDGRLIAHGLVGAFMNTAMHWAWNDYREPLDVVVRNCALLFEALGAQVRRAAAASDLA